MDHYLVEYLVSGKAWLLIGSGPSTAAGYASWGKMAAAALAFVARRLWVATSPKSNVPLMQETTQRYSAPPRT